MTNIKSAIRNIKKNKRNNLQNRHYKGAIKRSVKNYFASLTAFKSDNTSANEDKVKETLKIVYSKIDKAKKKKLFIKIKPFEINSNLLYIMQP